MAYFKEECSNKSLQNLFCNCYSNSVQECIFASFRLKIEFPNNLKMNSQKSPHITTILIRR